MFASCCPLTVQLALLAAPATVHVAPTGDDRAAGTASQPFATLARARGALRAAPRDHPRTVIVHGGVYRVTARWSWDGRLGHGALVGNVASGQLRDGASGRRSAADGLAAGARPGGARPLRAGGAPGESQGRR